MKRWMGVAVLALCGAAQAMPPAEEAKAKALLARVEAAKDVVFVRNGTDYGSANAAEFLRRKCVKEWGKFATAREFVARCASVSSTSGKPYQMKVAGGAPRASEDVLGEWLAAIEAEGKAAPR